MKITAIKQQVKQAGRYSIFVDGKFSFGLSESALIDSGIKIGLELDEARLAELKDTAKIDKGYNRTLHLIARRARSEWEIRDFLKRKEYEPEFVDAIVARLYERRYLDDEAFARMWVENRRLLKPTSRRKLTLELKQKRVSSEVIDQVLGEDKDVTDEREVLRELVLKKQSRYPDQSKFMQYLARQGYSYDDIKSVLSNPVDEDY